MSKKPKFLYRLAEYDAWFASLGRKLKAMKQDGVPDLRIKKRYIEQRDLLMERNVTVRHIRWQKVYDTAFKDSHERALNELDRSEKQALKYARQKGEQAVVEAFPNEVSTSRAVRDAMNEIRMDDD